MLGFMLQRHSEPTSPQLLSLRRNAQLLLAHLSCPSPPYSSVQHQVLTLSLYTGLQDGMSYLNALPLQNGGGGFVPDDPPWAPSRTTTLQPLTRQLTALLLTVLTG